MENKTEWKGPYFDRITGKELKMVREAAKKCAAIIDKMQTMFGGEELGHGFFRLGDIHIYCGLGKQGGYYCGRFLRVIETRFSGDWRRITTLHENQKDFPFVQYTESIFGDKPEIRDETSEDQPFGLEEKINKFSKEVDSWIPITSSSTE